jgi:hypothetical protein
VRGVFGPRLVAPRLRQVCQSANTAVTVRNYIEFHALKDRAKITAMIHLRFTERYLDPALDGENRNGFLIMAVGCLTVEALESFRNGWKDTTRKSEAAFCSFFQTHDEFKALRAVAHDFYRAVRCGILHQSGPFSQLDDAVL